MEFFSRSQGVPRNSIPQRGGGWRRWGVGVDCNRWKQAAAHLVERRSAIIYKWGKEREKTIGKLLSSHRDTRRGVGVLAWFHQRPAFIRLALPEAQHWKWHWSALGGEQLADQHGTDNKANGKDRLLCSYCVLLTRYCDESNWPVLINNGWSLKLQIGLGNTDNTITWTL